MNLRMDYDRKAFREEHTEVTVGTRVVFTSIKNSFLVEGRDGIPILFFFFSFWPSRRIIGRAMYMYVVGMARHGTARSKKGGNGNGEMLCIFFFVWYGVIMRGGWESAAARLGIASRSPSPFQAQPAQPNGPGGRWSDGPWSLRTHACYVLVLSIHRAYRDFVASRKDKYILPSPLPLGTFSFALGF